MLKVYKPDYDFEDRLKHLLGKLANCESTRLMLSASQSRLVGRLPGIVEFCKEITSVHPVSET
jgi:hypothetical protein